MFLTPVCFHSNTQRFKKNVDTDSMHQHFYCLHIPTSTATSTQSDLKNVDIVFYVNPKSQGYIYLLYISFIYIYIVFFCSTLSLVISKDRMECITALEPCNLQAENPIFD